MKILLALLLSPLLCFSLFGKEDNAKKPLSIVIIGAGPSGLATAIEAKQQGANVMLVEKRSAYTRRQWLFLFDASIKLLQKWHVETPQMKIASLDEECQVGCAPIVHLEQSLESKIQQLGIQKIQGEFKSLKDQRIAVIATAQDKELDLPYDLLVGADGTHSQVKRALAIDDDCLGIAFGSSALMPNSEDTPTEVSLSPPIKWESSFLAKLSLPSACILFIQGPEKLSKEEFQKAVADQGWHREASLIANGKSLFIQDIEIFLRQARSFSNREKSAILIGDAAATASFFQGMGANTALKTAEIAGRFFKGLQEESKTAYEDFDREMQETTDLMIEDSRFLFQ